MAAACWLVLGALLLAPLGLILIRGVFPNILNGSFAGAFSRWAVLASRADLQQALGNSFALALLVVAGSLVLGVASGAALAHDDLPGKAVLGPLLFAPLLTPPYVGALAWMLMMEPGGFAERLLGIPTERIQSLFFSLFGIAAVMSLHLFPFVMLPVRLALQRGGGRHAVVARTAGAGAWQAFRRITLPLLAPACVSGGLIVLVASLEEFGVAATLGRQANIWVITTEIQRLITTFPSDAPLAATLSLALVAVTAGLFVAQARLQRRARPVTSVRLATLVPYELRRWRWPACALLAAMAAVASVAPWLAVLASSVLRAQSGPLSAANLTLQRYALLLSTSQPRLALGTSLWLAGIAATVATALGLTVAYLHVRLRQPGAQLLDGASLLPGSVPAIVIALGLLTMWSVLPTPDAVYRSPIVVALAYTVLYLPLSVRYATAALASQSPRLEQMARSCGASSSAAMWRIVLPQLRPWLVGSWLTVFAISIRELVASLIVRPPGSQTTAVYIFERFEQGDLGQGMAMALVTLVVTLTLLAMATRLGVPAGEQAVL
ncbi:MAG: iron ABC transporter permease [Chloroflexi bacterium]|nr:iron ABC transporter permease [Chloroflexota bacterium]